MAKAEKASATVVFAFIAVASLLASPQTTDNFNVYGDSNLTLLNGYWCYHSDLTAGNCAALVATHEVSYVYMQTGQWQNDGSIDLLATAGEINTAVANAQGAGLKIYAWVIDDTENVPIGDAGERATAVASLIALCDAYGFDGVADDIEVSHTTANLIAFWNAAKIALNAEPSAYEYFTTIIAYWAFDPNTFSNSDLASVNVDRFQLMLYDLSVWSPYSTMEATFKAVLDRFLTYTTCPVAVALGTHGGWTPTVTFATSLSYTDQQLFTSPTLNIEGFDVFDYSSTDSGEFTSWDDWQTKTALPLSVYTGFSGFPGYSDQTYSYAAIDDVIAQMDTDNLGVYRMSFIIPDATHTGTTPAAVANLVNYFLYYTDYTVVVDPNHYYNYHLMTSSEWTAAIQRCIDVLSLISINYADRVWMEVQNEQQDSSIVSHTQAFVTAVRNAGYTNPLVSNVFWQPSYPQYAIAQMANINDPLDKFYTGHHVYLDQMPLTSAKSVMQAGLDAGVKIINTEIGAHASERYYFNTTNVAQINEFMSWCTDRGIGNCLWMRVALENLPTYESLGLEWPPNAVYVPQVSAPVFYPAADTYSSTQSVTMTSTSGASIYYTTNGDTPDSGDTLYSTAVSVASTTTLKAIGIKASYTNSPVTVGVYTINAPPPVAAPIVVKSHIARLMRS